MARVAFPTTPIESDELRRNLARWPAVRADVEARLARTTARIASFTVEEARSFPERTDQDWPDLAGLPLDPAWVAAKGTVWWRVVAAVERRVQAIDPDAGGECDAFCYPVWRIYDRHWLAVAEAAGCYAVEPLLPEAVRSRLAAQIRLWAGASEMVAGPVRR